LRCRGLLDDDPDKLVAAVEEYRKSPRVVERAGACEDAAGSLARKGSSSAARALFEEALGLYDTLDASRDSSRVLSAMRAFGIRRGSRAPRRRPATGWDALTPTEVQVARLTVEGLTNPKIAERLFISRNTVQTHLSHIFIKLGIGSRVELAALAAKANPAETGTKHPSVE
jgi:DNA-binding CsgD family transcriptional regulator